MKVLYKILVLICINSSIYAQAIINESAEKVLQITASQTSTTASIAEYIRTNFKSDRERLAAIYRWVTYNIKYDTDSMYVFNWGADPELKITAALRRRKGVCENYAALMNDITNKCGITSYVVSGYTRQSGRVNSTGHSWCAVNINNEWTFCDPTWDENYRYNSNYFMVSPARFIQSHMPFDPLWQLLESPLNSEEFKKGYQTFGKTKPFYNYSDTLQSYLRMDELHQLESSYQRIKRLGEPNELVKNRLAYIRMEIHLIYENENMHLYNNAADDINKAAASLNAFIAYRNNQFQPDKTDSEIFSMLEPVESKIISARDKIDNLARSAINHQYNIESLSQKIERMQMRLTEQRTFVNLYTKTEKQARAKLFYTEAHLSDKP